MVKAVSRSIEKAEEFSIPQPTSSVSLEKFKKMCDESVCFINDM